MLGATQKAWVKRAVPAGKARWNLFTSETMMMALDSSPGNSVNQDQWDGYAAERHEILTSFVDAKVQNLVVLSGDLHTFIAGNLTTTGDDNSTLYETDSTNTNVSTTDPPPDVYLNASVSVAEIDLTVTNLTAKLNLDAQVLSLLTFNAGVTASIDRVSLLIQNVSAKVVLEARLDNLLYMIADVLDSLDLNPVLATLGQDVTSIVNSTTSALEGTTSTLATRSYNIVHNVLYSINDYSGNTHTNRILSQNGSIIDQFLDNDGNVHSQNLVGYYSRDMTFNGYNQSVAMNGQADRELEYVYHPFPGIIVISAIYTNAAGNVVATQVLSESGGGGSSTVAADL